MIESTEIQAFGVSISKVDIVELSNSFAMTYEKLEKSEKSELWGDLGFRKREMNSLIDAIYDLLYHIEYYQDAPPELFLKNLKLDRENQEFISILHNFISENSAYRRIIEQMKPMDIHQGSIILYFKDKLRDSTEQVKINIDLLARTIHKNKDKIKTALIHLVEWTKNKSIKLLMGAELATGLLIISMITMNLQGIFSPQIKLLIAFSISLICAIAQIYTTAETFESFLWVLKYKFGLDFGK